MGSSKIVLVGATSLIVGIYSLSIKRVESSYVSASVNRAKVVQADRLVETGLRLALSQLARHGGWFNASRGRKALGGTFSYTISNSTGTSADITMTVVAGGTTKVVTARAEKATGAIKKNFRSIHRGRWVVTKYYVKNG